MEMMPLNAFSWGSAFAAALLLLLCDARGRRGSRELSPKAHGRFCAAVFLLGCGARLARLSSLPAGLSAEEALTAVQAGALWRTGGFFPAGGLTAQLPQWTGDPAGPLLAALTAPAVGLFGMRPLAARLPLALISCLSLPAAYGIGRELAGRRGGRWMLLIWAFSPFFVFSARLTAAPGLALCLAAPALYLSLLALRRPGALPAACALLALLSFAHDLYAYLSPALVLLLCLRAVRCGCAKGRAACAAAIGLLLCLPGILTVYASRPGGADIRLGPLLCPHLEEYGRAATVLADMKGAPHPERVFLEKLWAVLEGGFFQDVMHENISGGLFFPAGMTALFLVSVPLALAGILFLLSRLFRGDGLPPACGLLASFALASLLAEVFVGSRGNLEIYGATSVWDYAQLFPYTALLVLAGCLAVSRRSGRGALAAAGLYLAGFAAALAYLFCGGYAAQANVYFTDFPQAAARASAISRETGMPVCVTASVFPHAEPDEAARFLFLAASDADPRTEDPEIIWPESQDAPEAGRIHLVLRKEAQRWYWTEEEFGSEAFGRYVLLVPKGGKNAD